MKHKAFRWMVIMLCVAMLLPASFAHAASAVAGVPTEVAAYPGDRTIVLHWKDPDEGPAGVYQIQIGEGSWISYATDSLRFDAVNGKWVHLFGGLTNGREYTFRIRAIDGEGMPGSAIAVQSTPVSYGSVQEAITDLLSLQDVPLMQASFDSPRLSATDLYAIHDRVLMPPGGWTGRPDPGEGLSRDKPHRVT
ncbi:MAG: fibronectin type III domain-containing protein, partial [Clostridiales bacterium]|nr:fibronectin type III domain-containing protein [Clostridiales bacterium]